VVASMQRGYCCVVGSYLSWRWTKTPAIPGCRHCFETVTKVSPASWADAIMAAAISAAGNVISTPAPLSCAGYVLPWNILPPSRTPIWCVTGFRYLCPRLSRYLPWAGVMPGSCAGSGRCNREGGVREAARPACVRVMSTRAYWPHCPRHFVRPYVPVWLFFVAPLGAQKGSPPSARVMLRVLLGYSRGHARSLLFGEELTEGFLSPTPAKLN